MHRQMFQGTPYLLTAILLLLASCDKLPFTRESGEDAPVASRATLDEGELSRAIGELLADRQKTERKLTERIAYFDTLRRVYAQYGYAPLWVKTGLVSGDINAILRHLQTSDAHGLEPRRYHYRKLESLIRKHLLQGIEMTGPVYRDFATIDLLLSDGLLRYAKDLRAGVLNPKELDPTGFFIPVRTLTYDELVRPLVQQNIGVYLEKIQPAESRYKLLQSALAYYRDLARRSFWKPIPQINGKLRRDTVSSIIPLVAERLNSLAFSTISASGMTSRIPPSPILFPSLYSTAFMDRVAASRGKYDTTLVLALRQFQSDHGLLPDGIIGKGTIDVLNVPPEERVRQIQVNLDRLRWFQLPEEGYYARVNIPEFYLYGIADGMHIVKMKVCVGERFRGWWIHGHKPMNYETPQLYGKFAYLVLNPQWNVPASIATRETYYQAKKDPTYLLRNNYRVFRGDSLVNPLSVDWASLNADKLPFRFVQGAGRGNALGRIKFMFYNDFDVYLHDTPKRLPFRQAVRAVSHGCVRIEEPMAFVRYLLKGHTEWSAEKIQSYLNQTQEGKIVFLQRKVPIYLDYITAWVDGAGRIQLRDDIYGKDRVMKEALLRAMGK